MFGSCQFMCWRLVPMSCFPRSTMPGGQQPQKHYGITSAISHAPPREIDHQYTKKLCDAMKPFGVFEDEEELNHRWGTASIIFFLYYHNTIIGHFDCISFHHLIRDTYQNMNTCNVMYQRFSGSVCKMNSNVL